MTLNRIAFCIIAVFALLASACNSVGSSKGTKTEHGFRFINHTNNPGDKAKPGDAVVINSYTYAGDSLLASTAKMFGGPKRYDLFTLDALPERVPALFDAALLMAKGDSATIYETVDSFILKFLPPTLKNVKEIRYEIVMVDIVNAERREAEQQEIIKSFEAIQANSQVMINDFKAGKLKGKLQTLPSGVSIFIAEKGDGETIKPGEMVSTHYYGCLQSNGQMFDNSFQRGEPMQFASQVGQMIPGFD
ncbi:MAG: FKBP-type peptidyl-prolyl cis-trans isomerase, partial [Saprospiraceae bacterium]